MRQLLLIAIFLFLSPQWTFAQEVSPSIIITPSVTTTPTNTPTPVKKTDVTNPKENSEKEIAALFKDRPENELSWKNVVPYYVQFAVKAGVPASTVTLILLLPLLATIIAMFRYIVGLPTLGLLVPVALSITLLATDISAGLVLLGTIILGSGFARMLLKKVRIMQLPKQALSMMVVSVSIFIALTVCAATDILSVTQISIFPVLLLILLSDNIVTLFSERSLYETIQITLVTILLGLLGFLLLSWDMLRSFILLYPEVILLLIPINIIVGRYFGLRMTEYIRFQPVLKHASK